MTPNKSISIILKELTLFPILGGNSGNDKHNFQFEQFFLVRFLLLLFLLLCVYFRAFHSIGDYQTRLKTRREEKKENCLNFSLI
jgi:hypothetical protein